MLNTFFSILISLISAYLYDLIKEQIKKHNTSKPTIKYSEKYISDVKLEFYISFAIGIFLTAIRPIKHSFLNHVVTVISYMSFFISLMGFMCLVDVVNYFFNNNSND